MRAAGSMESRRRPFGQAGYRRPEWQDEITGRGSAGFRHEENIVHLAPFYDWGQTPGTDPQASPTLANRP
jgi:hypothetical protein